MDRDQQEIPRIHPEHSMRVDVDDRLSGQPAARGWKTGHLAAGVAIMLVIVAVLLYPGGGDEELAEIAEPAPVVQPEPAPEPVPELPPAPDIPVVEPVAEVVPEEEPQADAEPEVVVPEEPPLALEDSDEPVRIELSMAGDSALMESALTNTDLLQRGAGVIDGFSRGLVLNKILPVAPPAGKFQTRKVGDTEYIDPASYARYDSYARSVAELDTEQLVSTFHRFRPLLEQAYEALGYESDELDNALIRSLDQVIATPEIDGDIAVKRKEAVYIYIDPALEQLSPLQKQVLRTGPQNTAKIKGQAVALREGLLAEAR